MRLPSLPLLLAGPVLVLTLACGGSSESSPNPAPAKGLAYTDPAGSGWRLVRDASSTPERLVLNLVGPSGTKTRGVGFNLQAPATVHFGAFANGLPIQDTGVYQLLSAAGDPTEPVALVGGVKPGNLLTVGIYQKGRDQAAQDSGAPLCQVAIRFDPASKLARGEKLPLRVTKARAIPEDIGSANDDLWTLDKKLRMADLSIAVGTLSAY